MREMGRIRGEALEECRRHPQAEGRAMTHSNHGMPSEEVDAGRTS
jgi:hypothetical protein